MRVINGTGYPSLIVQVLVVHGSTPVVNNKAAIEACASAVRQALAPE